MNDESHNLIAEINSSLSLATKRQNGLFKMISFLENCNSSSECTILEQNCPFWIKTLFQILENHAVSLHAKLAQYAFFLVIQISKSLSAELQRHISTSLIEKSISLLISCNDMLSKNSLMCLNELISCYKTPCSQFRAKIENYVYTRLEDDSDDLIKWSGICYAKLPYLHKNANNTDFWYLYFKNMLLNVGSLLNELFEDYQSKIGIDSHDMTDQSESMNSNQRSEIRYFPKLTKDSENMEFYFKKSLQRYKACLSCLTNLLEPLSERTCINVRLNEVIEFLKRIFLFDFKKLKNNCRINSESNYLNDIMNGILISTFEFCSKFFSVLNTNLIPHTPVINNILINIGRSIDDNNSLFVLSSFYDCLNVWMSSLGSNCAFYKNSFNLIENLLKNIKPFEKNKLSIENNKNDHLKIRNKQKSSILLNEDKTGISTFQMMKRNKLITSALECLRTYLKIFSFNLSYNQFEKIHTSLIDMILYVQYNSNARKPYDQQETRLSLYEALFDLCLTKNTKLAPPLSVAIGLFKNALNDQALRIQQYAKNSLNFLRAFTCPLEPIFLKEFTIESKIEISNKEHQLSHLVLPSMNDEHLQNSDLKKNEFEQSEIAQYMTKKLNSDQVKETINQLTNKRKFKYEDDEDEDENESENENVYNPKNIAKKFQSNGHFHNRSLLNGRDIENSNGEDEADEDEIEEEVISLNDQEDDDEVEDESEMDEDDENDDESEEEMEEEGEEESNENEDNLQDGELSVEKVAEQILTESQDDPQGELKIETREKSPPREVAEEVKNLLKETGDDYDDEDDEESKESQSKSKTSQIADIDNQYQETSINKFEDEQIESEIYKILKCEHENSEQKPSQEKSEKLASGHEEESKVDENSENFPSIQDDESKTDERSENFPSAQEEESKAEDNSENFPSILQEESTAEDNSEKFPSVEEDESKREENKEFGEKEFNQICATLNLNALAKTN